MWNYGRKIIDIIFKRRTDSSPICHELERKVQADSDRRDIGVFEVGLPVERHGDNEQGARTASRKESERLIRIAKEHGLYVPKSEWGRYGDRKSLPSGESVVFLDLKENRVVKIRNPFAKSAIKGIHSSEVIYEHLIHNILFPDARYTFVGISDDVDGVRIILSQPYIRRSFVSPSQEDIERHLIKKLGLSRENRYFYGNDYISVTDVSVESDNVLVDGEKLCFIDPLIRFKRPAMEVWNYYYDFLM